MTTLGLHSDSGAHCKLVSLIAKCFLLEASEGLLIDWFRFSDPLNTKQFILDMFFPAGLMINVPHNTKYMTSEMISLAADLLANIEKIKINARRKNRNATNLS